jgi:hypothetical protein
VEELGQALGSNGGLTVGLELAKMACTGSPEKLCTSPEFAFRRPGGEVLALVATAGGPSLVPGGRKCGNGAPGSTAGGVRR